MKKYYIRNNITFVVSILYTALKQKEYIEIAELALIVPLLLDEEIVSILNDSEQKFFIETIIATNKIPLANYNDRYLSLLPQLYTAIAMMLDTKAINMRDGCLVRCKGLYNLNSITKEESNARIHQICVATNRLMALIENKDIPRLYNLLKIEL